VAEDERRRGRGRGIFSFVCPQHLLNTKMEKLSYFSLEIRRLSLENCISLRKYFKSFLSFKMCLKAIGD